MKKKFNIPSFVLIFSLLCVLMLSSCKEKNEDFPPHKWSEFFFETEGIAPRSVSAIFFENDHSFWLGARGNEGILHKDAYKWNVYDKSVTGIDFDSITAIVRDGNGKLWVGWKSGLATFDGSKWQNISTFSGLKVTSVVVEGIGNIKVSVKGSSGGVASLSKSAWTFTTTTNSEIPSGNINAMASSPDQALWLATADSGIVKYNNGTWTNMIAGIPLLSKNFTCISAAPDGSIWAGSVASQIIRFYQNTITVLNTGTSAPITSLVVDDNKNVWCSTSGAGLIKFDGQNWTVFSATNSALPTNEILCMSKCFPGYLLFSRAEGQVYLFKQ